MFGEAATPQPTAFGMALRHAVALLGNRRAPCAHAGSRAPGAFPAARATAPLPGGGDAMSPQPNQIERLLNAFLDESLNDSEAAQLRAALAADPALARRLVEELEWEVVLRSHLARALVTTV